MAQSLKLSPFTSLGTPNNILSDDYVHGTFETYKIKGATTNGGKLDYKVKVNTVKKDDKITANIVDEGKVQFPVGDRFTVQLGQRRKGDLRAHLDLGQVSLHGKQWNLFTNVKTETSLSKFQFRLGTNYFGKACESNTRLELTPGEAPIITHRNYVTRGKIYYGIVGSLNLSTLNLLRYDLLAGFADSKYEINLKHESNSKASSVDVGTLTTTATYFHDANTKAAFEVSNKGRAFAPSGAVGAQHKLPNGVIVKGKLDNKLNLSVASKYALNKQFTLTAAIQLAFGSKQVVDLSKFPPIPFGLQLDINV